MNSKIYLLISSFLFSFSAWSMGLNDLSILLPLPRTQEFSRLISPYEVGAQGQLLSAEVYQQMFQLLPEFSNKKVWAEQLKVVAIRLDPCFVEGSAPLACRRQIRLVWQPMNFKNGEWVSRDAAIHSFYEFGEKEFLNIVSEWSNWAQTNEKEALTVHPVIAQEGLTGESWRKLRSIILKHCGEKSLIRMTTMNVTGNEQLWIFSGFDLIQGKIREMIIPRIETKSQAITQSSFNFKTFTGGMTPAPEEDIEFNQLVESSHWFNRTSSIHEKTLSMKSALSYENPRIHNTATLDCASCHLANMAHQWGVVNFPDLPWSTELLEEQFQSGFNLSNPTANEIRPNQFRVFGYFEKNPAIARRVIHETASVAEYLVHFKQKLKR